MIENKSIGCKIFSDLTAVDAVCRDARGLLERHGQIGCGFTVELLLREMINNAMIHGNALDSRKHVDVSVQIGRKWIVLRIADEGPGFDWRKAKRIPPDTDATSGRGLAIAVLYAQRIQFNRSGNQVTIWIRKMDE